MKKPPKVATSLPMKFREKQEPPSQGWTTLLGKRFAFFFFRQQKKLYRATSQHSTSLFSVQAFCQGKYARRVRTLQRKIRMIRVGEDHYGLKITTLAEFSGWRRNRDLLTSKKRIPGCNTPCAIWYGVLFQIHLHCIVRFCILLNISFCHKGYLKRNWRTSL